MSAFVSALAELGFTEPWTLTGDGTPGTQLEFEKRFRRVAERQENVDGKARTKTVEIARPPEFGITWAELKPVLLRHVQAEAERDLAAARDAALLKVAGGASDAERSTWPAKAEAARAYLAGDQAGPAEPILQEEADATGEDVAELAAKINGKARAWATKTGRIAGRFRRGRNKVRQTKSIAGVGKAATAEIDAIAASTEQEQST